MSAAVDAQRQRVVLALDAGGTSTRALVVDAGGAVLGAARAGSGNPTSSGATAALGALGAAARAALAHAGLPAAAVTGTVLAMAGQQALYAGADLAGALGLAPGARLDLAPDVLALYCSGAAEQDGGAVVAGTGSVGARVAGGSVQRVVGGSGWLLGDGGSGFATGHRVARAAVADLDGSGPATALTDAVLAAVGLPAAGGTGADGRPAVLAGLLDVLYRDRPVALAQLAPLAFAAPQDPVAADVVRAVHDELATTISAVRGTTGGAPALPGPLVLGGSVLERAVLPRPQGWSPALVRALAGADVRATRDGAVGAAVLALRAAGVPVGPAELQRLRAGAPVAG